MISLAKNALRGQRKKHEEGTTEKKKQDKSSDLQPVSVNKSKKEM